MHQRLDWKDVSAEGLAALRGVEAYIARSKLDRRLVELVKMRASQINGCAYCLHMHSLDARKLGEREERLLLLDAWHESALYTPRERAALAWTEALTRIADTHAPDHVYEQVRQEFDEQELADLSIAIAMINAWNRLAIGFRASHPADVAQAA